MSANPLRADVVVHYGCACPSPSESVPVVYAFGVSDVGDESGKGRGDTCWGESVRLALEEVAG